MTIGDLLARIDGLVPLTGVHALPAPLLARKATSIDYDSRRVVPGGVFVAVRGLRADGAAFAPQAASRGAALIVAGSPAPEGFGTPWLVGPDARRVLAAAAVAFYDSPSESLRVLGVTGTNGKTTTIYLLSDILESAGMPCGRIGTVSYRVGAEERPAPRTTPEAPDVQRLLRAMVDAGSAACAMEVSSHALALRRVEFMRFEGALFTNLTRDHLDFHGSMEDYFLAKRRLFELLPPGAPAIVNVDDPYGARLASEFPRALTFALERPADIVPVSLSLGLDGITAELRTPHGPVTLRSPLLGRPNAYNLIGAVALALALGLPTDAVQHGASRLRQVPGRLQRVSEPNDEITVLVDYAHTDDALKNLLETARPLSRGRLITVFGCGGDRDRTKRPLMGAVAGRLSDFVVLTSDNPRSEDPAAIIEEIKKGLVPPDRARVRNAHPSAPVGSTAWTANVDRRAAIVQAVSEALAGDTIVIAGKGHEAYQEIGGRTLPFDDVAVAREALDARRRKRRKEGGVPA